MEIPEISPQGEGVARIQGFVIFVADAKPGDHAKNKDYKNWRYER